MRALGGGRAVAALSIAAAVALSGCALGAARSVTYISDRGATVNAYVYSSVAGPTSWWVEYGKDQSYGTSTPVRKLDLPGQTAEPASEPIAGLQADTTYHYRVCARGPEADAQAGCGKDATLMTKPAGGSSAIAFVSSRPGNDEIYAIDPDGRNLRDLTNNPADDRDPSWSPDGTKLAFTRKRDIWVMNADGTDPHNLTRNAAGNARPSWSPDGTRIAFVIGGSAIYVMSADGSGATRLAYDPLGRDYLDRPRWSPDGARITYGGLRYGFTESDISVMNANGSDRHEIVWPRTDGAPSWSPDGTKIAFGYYTITYPVTSDLFTVDPNVTVDPNGNNLTRLTANGASISPSWSPDGKRIVFVRAPAPGTLYTMDADGSNQTPLIGAEAQHGPPDPVWSPRP